MSEGPIIFEGVTLMLLGMGFVFCFLALLVGATSLLSRIAIRIQPATPQVAAATPKASSPSSDDSMVAAITAALHHHKKKLSQQL